MLHLANLRKSFELKPMWEYKAELVKSHAKKLGVVLTLNRFIHARIMHNTRMKIVR